MTTSAFLPFLPYLLMLLFRGLLHSRPPAPSLYQSNGLFASCKLYCYGGGTRKPLPLLAISNKYYLCLLCCCYPAAVLNVVKCEVCSHPACLVYMHSLCTFRESVMLWRGGFRGMPIRADGLRNVLYCCTCTKCRPLGHPDCEPLESRLSGYGLWACVSVLEQVPASGTSNCRLPECRPRGL